MHIAKRVRGVSKTADGHSVEMFSVSSGGMMSLFVVVSIAIGIPVTKIERSRTEHGNRADELNMYIHTKKENVVASPATLAPPVAAC